MKPAVAAQYVLIERTSTDGLALVFVAAFALAVGFLVGDWTSEPRFAEREAAILQTIERARADVDRVRDSIKRGCYEYIDPTRPRSSTFAREM